MRDWVFKTSSCDRRNLQALIVVCHNPKDPMEDRLVPQSCRANELCVDTGLSIGGARAYCVNTQNFKMIPNSDRERKTRSIFLEIPVNKPPFVANALLADQFRTSPFLGATSFDMAALERRDDVVFVLERARRLAEYNLRIQPLPQGTNLLRASVAVSGSPSAYLYLITIS